MESSGDPLSADLEEIALIRSIRWGRAVKRLNRFIRTTIKSRRSSGEAGHDLLGSLLTARNSDGDSISDEQLHDEILTFFLAGHETAALSLTCAAYLLASTLTATT